MINFYEETIEIVMKRDSATLMEKCKHSRIQRLNIQVTLSCSPIFKELLSTLFSALTSIHFNFFLILCKKIFVTLNRIEISKKRATSKKSKQILGGCYLGAFTAGEIEELSKPIP